MEHCDTLVIGGGPAGLFAASHLHKGSKIVLLEKNINLGEKLNIAGSGRCNITHTGPIMDFISKYGDNGRFLRNALLSFTNLDLISFFNTRGVDTICDANGKVFPKSEKAVDIIDTLITECRKRGVLIKTGAAVLSIRKTDDGFLVLTEKNTYLTRQVIIATGGKSYPATGSTGDGYKFVKAFGHAIVEPRPSLSPVFIKEYMFAGISGVSLTNRPIHLYRNGKKIREYHGDIGFTHKGLSGPGILDFSRYFLTGDMLKINMIDLPLDTLRDNLILANEKNGKMSVKNFLKKYDLPESLIKAVLEGMNMDVSITLACLTKQMRNQIVDQFCNHPFVIGKIGSFQVAMATTGGIHLKEVSPKTMQSRLVEGLYFAGELMDIDGDTGGYNIQAAFSTGFLAANAINKLV
ncbi:MAG: NAD(P)/FAD-dependent oxidoreductase [Proteobacteria bacterium]|nr:NAD(P)/FAD-dependent oxidoreductase [Pseudomonadota bacterium]